MRLTTLLGAMGAVPADGTPAAGVEVEGLTTDSRRVRPGELFFALPGAHADGHAFLEQARSQGAVGAVVSRRESACPLPQFLAADTRAALALAAAEFYDYPSRKFPLIGVTGTNGKTTITFLVRELLARQGMPCGLLGTVRNILGPSEVLGSSLTTPFADEIQRMLARMHVNGCRAAVMEVSSHGLDQQRSLGCRFEVAVFTNLTPDHLDYHRDMEDYFRAKCLLFEHLGTQGRAVVGWDDPYGERLAAQVKGPLLTYGERPGGTVRIARWEPRADGAWIALEVFGRAVEAEVQLVGRFNGQNIAACAAVGAALGITPERIAEGLPTLTPVPGRMERVRQGQPFTVLVDYAHTPDALEKALQAAREHTRGKLVSLFGCGGDRYRQKRPMMGGISVRLADATVITSDNPRSEQPGAIIGEIVAGAEAAGGREGERFSVVPDRREAIFQAISGLREGDLLLIAGKGHEDYQLLPTGKIHFDDREVAAEALAERGYRG